ncbi:MAG: 50S ribosome-binding GTPase, partial [Planctomycetes bacterium]|nr:50S ribosome-binding GTPase [Planctomycetota bacterium]
MEIVELLRQNENKDLLRLITAGSVDDGKSTLIGRLLYEANGIYEDQLFSVRKASGRRGSTQGELDLSLVTDGLKAEREQGITIDVAYRYFSTPMRKFIIADTPGHEQYTRNMATGASTASLMIILIDARNGVLPQSKRHAFIASLLGIQHVLVAVNKMDLVGYSREVFEKIRADFENFASRLLVKDMVFIPVSALAGDNIVSHSPQMPWYEGTTLLNHLQTVHIASDRNLIDLRLPVQFVNRFDDESRGYMGTVVSGVVRPGEEILILPVGSRAIVKKVFSPDGEAGEAFASGACTITLDRQVDVSRGNLIVHPHNVPRIANNFDATLVWMS